MWSPQATEKWLKTRRFGENPTQPQIIELVTTEWVVDDFPLDSGEHDRWLKTLEELGWEWVDAYDGKANNHPFCYGHFHTFDPEVVEKTKKSELMV